MYNYCMVYEGKSYVGIATNLDSTGSIDFEDKVHINREFYKPRISSRCYLQYFTYNE